MSYWRLGGRACQQVLRAKHGWRTLSLNMFEAGCLHTIPMFVIVLLLLLFLLLLLLLLFDDNADRA